MNTTQMPTEDGAVFYEIRLKGHLAERWINHFGDVSITLEENGKTRLTSKVIDQAALFGLLKKIRDVGLPLLSVNRIERGGSDVFDE